MSYEVKFRGFSVWFPTCNSKPCREGDTPPFKDIVLWLGISEKKEAGHDPLGL